jgi:hypothetical protein
MRVKGWILLVLIVLLCCFCVYTYKLRTAFNVDKQDAQIEVSDYQLEVVQYALSLFPQKDKGDIFFNSIGNEYPDFKEDERLCEILGYQKTPAEIEQNKAEQEAEDKKGIPDTTVAKVMDNILTIEIEEE